MPNEINLYPPTVWSCNWPDGHPNHGKVCREIAYDLYERAIVHNRVGDLLYHYASAPGSGSATYRITRITPQGVFAVCIDNTIRELSPSECY